MAVTPITIDGLPTLTINGLATYSGSFDGVNDIIPVYENATTSTVGVSRNTLLGLSSAPVGLTDSQTLTNKVLTAPTISGPTFSGTLIGTYTIGGTPTFPSSVVTLSGSQTLTNKILTSPTINSPTINNATISADTITGYTTSTNVTVGGVSLDNGAIGGTSATLSGGLDVTGGTVTLPAASIVPNNLVSSSGSSWAWQSWTPSWTNVTLGNGSSTGYYAQVGKVVVATFILVLGSTSTMGSSPYFIVPVTPSSNYSSSYYQIIGDAFTTPDGLAIAMSLIMATSVATGAVLPQWAAQSSGQLVATTASVPATWGTGNYIAGTITYEAA